MIAHRDDGFHAHGGAVFVIVFAVFDFHDAGETGDHDLHVRFDDRIAKTTELLHVLLAHHPLELFAADAVIVEE